VGTAPNRGWHTVGTGEPKERHRGPRSPSVDTPVGRGKGTGAAPTRDDAARVKAAVVVEVHG
jgi:hypothetical protein